MLYEIAEKAREISNDLKKNYDKTDADLIGCLVLYILNGEKISLDEFGQKIYDFYSKTLFDSAVKDYYEN